MKMLLRGKERVTPKSGKSPFTMLHTSYPKHGVDGEVTEAIYIADDFPLPPLVVGMFIDVDRDGKGYLINVTEVEPPATSKLNVKTQS
jgi:hypothetical protein